MNNISGRVLEVVDASYEWPKDSGKKVPKWEVSVAIGTETKKYSCYSKRIAELNGKEIEFTTEPAKKAGYPDTLKLVGDEQKQSWNGKGKSYVDNGPTTAWDTILMQGIEFVKITGIKDKKEAFELLVKFQNAEWDKYNRQACGKTPEPVTAEVIPF